MKSFSTSFRNGTKNVSTLGFLGLHQMLLSNMYRDLSLKSNSFIVQNIGQISHFEDLCERTPSVATAKEKLSNEKRNRRISGVL